MINNNVAFRGSVNGTAKIKDTPIETLKVRKEYHEKPNQTARELVENAKPGEIYRETNPKTGAEQSSLIILEKKEREGEPVLAALFFNHESNGCGEGYLRKDTAGKYAKLGSLDITI